MRVSQVFAMGGHGQEGTYPYCGCYGSYEGPYLGDRYGYGYDYGYYNGYNYGGYTYYGRDRRLGKL
ncbi:MAG: hypothetical protein JO364_15805 [Pseudonocardiales bacterium]|nr:hypothetical protein [Pseudonocardiales bacterium]MBV8539785.1 hypothetical protein [Pseudonocardiales bacterium]MBV9031733.1 hypothetical protein [Pseudonocardiales bacterium]